jgi:hypothetical protein
MYGIPEQHHFEVKSQHCHKINLQGAGSAREISSILVRDNCLIVKLEHLKAIIFANGLLLFDADKAVVEEFAFSLRKALKTRPEKEPFEFRVLDTMLSAVTMEFENRFEISMKFLMIIGYTYCHL